MKNLLAVIILSFILYIPANSQGNKKDQNKWRSEIFEADNFAPWQTSSPYPFERYGDFIGNPKNRPAISTGYYFVISGDKSGEPWTPQFSFLDTTEDESNWVKIVSGPKQIPMSFWEQNKHLGFGFFRNPDNPADSTDNAIAGPIPIGFRFKFNSIEYDSFYVSTNGCIALSNRRYFYDAFGNKEERENIYGNPDCYDPMSADWFRRAERCRDWKLDNKPDNFGWLSVTGGANAGAMGGIRNPYKRPDTIADETGAGIIAPLYGDGFLPLTYNHENNGKVYYYKDVTNGKLIIYFVNYRIIDTLKTPYGNKIISNPYGMKFGDDGYVTADFQIVLDSADNSITYHFEKFEGRLFVGGAKQYTEAKEVFCGVFGFGRHQSYNSKKAEDDPDYEGTLPWGGEYSQYTYAWSKFMTTENVGFPNNTQSIKFKQWENTLRACDLAFRVRKKKKNSPYYSENVLTSEAENYEILAGHEQIGQLQPVAIIQNLSNDIQGPEGINYQPQDLNFRVRCAVINQTTKRPLYNKYLKIDSIALASKTGEEAFERTILSKVSFDGKDYTADTMHHAYYNSENKLNPYYNGIPPYGFVQIYFPPFEPNELFINHIGLMKAFLMIDPTDPGTVKKFDDMWSFDDTLNVRFWTMRNIPNDEQFIERAEIIREFRSRSC